MGLQPEGVLKQAAPGYAECLASRMSVVQWLGVGCVVEMSCRAGGGGVASAVAGKASLRCLVAVNDLGLPKTPPMEVLDANEETAVADGGDGSGGGGGGTCGGRMGAQR